MSIAVPYVPGKKLARAYNFYMEHCVTEWMLFLDFDIMILNNHWYDMCISAIQEVGSKTGWITAVTNRIGAPQQKCSDAPKGDNIEEHAKYSRGRFEEFGGMVRRVPGSLSGFFILTSRTAWKKCGGFNEARGGMMGVDNDYSRALSRAGYQHYQLPGLYCYHRYRQKKKFLRW
jgi:GT2 family glycosyltransferase